MRIVLLTVLLAMLAPIATDAQTTMIVVPSNTSDPASDDAPPVGEFWDKDRTVWIATDPLALALGRPGYDVPRHMSLMLHFPFLIRGTTFGLGTTWVPSNGIVGPALSFQIHLWSFNREQSLFLDGRATTIGISGSSTLGSSSAVIGWRRFFRNHLVVSGGIGVDASEGVTTYGSSGNAPHYPDGGNLIVQVEIGYAL